MQSAPKHNSIYLDRQAELRVWMFRNKVTFAEMGKALGITGTAVSKVVKSDHMPVRTHTALVNIFGVPPELLPSPLNSKPGPKSKQAPCQEGKHELTS